MTQIKYEDLSKEAQKGIENFRKELPRLLKERSVYEGLSFHFILNETLTIYLSIRHIFIGFCLSAGSSFKEAEIAEQFAHTKRYWLNG